MATQNQQQLIRPRSELDLDLDLDWDLALAQAADFPFAEAQRRDRDAGGALSDWAAWKQDVEIPTNSVEPSAIAVISPVYNPWEGQHQQLALVTPFTMQSQPQQPYQPHNYDPYYTPSTSTESTPPNGFVPYYIEPPHGSISPLHPNGPISPYPAGILSPSSPTSPNNTNALSDPEAEQKRLRNTAASARFRAKKKMREQSLERVSQERRTLLSRLEGRVKELEEENKWLKNLVWEKRDAREERELRLRRGEIDGVDGEGEGKREGDRNDGVGTSES